MATLTSPGGVFTWTTTGEIGSGTFVNGDPWVSGPTTILSRTPAPTGTGTSRRNGGMINPMNANNFSYDGRITTIMPYSAGLDAELTFPFVLNPGESLISGKSVASPTFPWPPSPNVSTHVSDMAVLTCLAANPAADTFRPSPYGKAKRLWTISDIDMSHHAVIPRPFNPFTSSSPINTTTKEMLNRFVPCLYNPISVVYDGLTPENNMFIYPANQGFTVGALMALAATGGASGAPATESLLSLYKVAQHAIDVLGAVQVSNTGWSLMGAGYGGSPLFAPLIWGYMLFGYDEFLREAQKPFVDTNIAGATNWSNPDGMGIDIGSFAECANYWYSPLVKVPTLPTPKPRNQYFGGMPMWGDANQGNTVANTFSNEARRFPGIGTDACSQTNTLWTTAEGWNWTDLDMGTYFKIQLRAAIPQAVATWIAGGQGYYPKVIRELIRRWINDPKTWHRIPSDVGNAFYEDIYGFGGWGDGFMRNLAENHLPVENAATEVGIKKYYAMPGVGGQTVFTSHGVRTF